MYLISQVVAWLQLHWKTNGVVRHLFPVTQMIKNPPAMQETWVQSRVGKIPWRRKWQPTPIFLPRESHEQRSWAGYSPWGRKELDTTKWLTFSLLHFYNECLDVRKVKLCTINYTLCIWHFEIRAKRIDLYIYIYKWICIYIHIYIFVYICRIPMHRKTTHVD